MRRRYLDEESIVGDIIYNKYLNSLGNEIRESGKLISPYIMIPDTCRTIQYYCGFSSSDPLNPDGGSIANIAIIEYDKSFKYLTYWAVTDHRGGRTVDIWEYGRTKYIRLTIKSSNLGNSYLKDVSNNQYLFKGSDYL
jgi:hypothetical protein